MIDKIKNVLAKQLRISKEEINDNSNIMEDLGADSLDIVEMLMVIEEQFNITIPDDDVGGLKTVKDIATYLDSHKK